MIAEGIGKRIKILRGQKSQNKFATELGITGSAIGFYENEERTPNANVIYKICMQTGVSADWLLGLPSTSVNDEILNQAAKYTEIADKLKELIKLIK